MNKKSENQSIPWTNINFVGFNRKMIIQLETIFKTMKNTPEMREGALTTIQIAEVIHEDLHLLRITN